MSNEQPRRYYLLAVGVANYDDPQFKNLNRVHEEVNDVVKLLTGPDFKMHRILEQESINPSGNTLSEQMAEWTVKENYRTTDQLVIYWSGHAIVETEQLHLILRDTKCKTHTPTLKSLDLIEKIWSYKSKFRGDVLFIFDVCFAGQSSFDLMKRLGL